MSTITDRGYHVVEESDPVRLRHRYQQAKADQHLLIITSKRVNELPYDLWNLSVHVDLALHKLFPNLDYPVLKELQPDHLVRLDLADQVPDHPLSPQQTKDFLLRTIFDAEPSQLARPATFILWLDVYHADGEPMPSVLAEHLLAALQRTPTAALPVADLLRSREAFRQYLREAWRSYVQPTIREEGEAYGSTTLSFEAEPTLQDAIPRLLRSGALTPIVVDDITGMPGWAQPAVAVDEPGRQLRLLEEGMAAISETWAENPLTWAQWQTVTRRWAELNLIWYGENLYRPQTLQERWSQIERELDQQFANWLKANYSRLGSRMLPPHHLHHILPFLVQQRTAGNRIALLVMDGMSLADWLLIKPQWQKRHTNWHIQEDLLLAQIPSITSISRQALVTGQRPAQFADSLTHNRYDERDWRSFWMEQGIATPAAKHIALPNRLDLAYPNEIDSRHTQVICIVSTIIDNMIHGATQGTPDVMASLRVWLNDGSYWLEDMIEHLFANQYRVFLTSDHGHVGAVGMGQPSEGVTVASRSKRARLYNQADFVQNVHQQYPHTMIWGDDGLLPAGWSALMPIGRYAFAPAGQQVVSHGGLTVDEIVVPFVSVVPTTDDSSRIPISGK